jgi:hypothetical protein
MTLSFGHPVCVCVRVCTRMCVVMYLLFCINLMEMDMTIMGMKWSKNPYAEIYMTTGKFKPKITFSIAAFIPDTSSEFHVHY